MWARCFTQSNKEHLTFTRPYNNIHGYHIMTWHPTEPTTIISHLHDQLPQRSIILAAMLSVATPLNIVCTCTECTSFLQPMPSSCVIWEQQVPNKDNANSSDHVWQKGGLADLWSPLIVSTQTSASTRTSSLASIWSINTTDIASSPSLVPATLFPKTPGAVRCTEQSCSARVPVASGLSLSAVLCERHEKELKDSVTAMMMGGMEMAESPNVARLRLWSTRMGSVGVGVELGARDVRIGKAWDKKSRG